MCHESILYDLVMRIKIHIYFLYHILLQRILNTKKRKLERN